jgi:hypothetical protein
MAAAIDGKDEPLDKLAVFGRYVESSSLYIVLAIDSSIDALQEVDQIARALALTCDNISNEISTNPILAGCLLDPGQKVVDGLSAGCQRIDDLLPGLMAQHSALEKMDVSDHDQRDLLAFAFERCIESFGWVVDAVKKLRQAIVAHDMATEPKSDENADVDAAVAGSLQSDAA